jgi:hypothetical protein
MKILSYIRGAFAVVVGLKDASGNIISRKFPKTMSDAEIKSVLCGTPIPEKAPALPGVPEKAEEKSVPEPPFIPKERVTRQQMIDALEAAGVTGYDSRSRESLTAAYRQLQKGNAK